MSRRLPGMEDFLTRLKAVLRTGGSRGGAAPPQSVKEFRDSKEFRGQHIQFVVTNLEFRGRL